MAEDILFLSPGYSHTIWGGNRLRTEFGYDEPGEDIGECWGISAYENYDSVVLNGQFKGTTLRELYKSHRDLFGDNEPEKFPLLTKIIDAKADLSIQVHPDDEYADIHENGKLGKKECWLILDCPENGNIVVGHNAKDKEDLCSYIDGGRFAELINVIPVKKGDFIQIDPGTVHAIKGGTLILETQQSSDVTYRLYDYDRLQNGKPRELHVDKCKDVITCPQNDLSGILTNTNDLPANKMNLLASNDRYSVYKLTVKDDFEFINDGYYYLMSVVEGEGYIDGIPLKKGNHFIVLKNRQTAKITGSLTIIASHR